LILLTDGLIAPKINLGDKSSHRCLVWAIRQSYFGGYEWNSIWRGGYIRKVRVHCSFKETAGR